MNGSPSTSKMNKSVKDEVGNASDITDPLESQLLSSFRIVGIIAAQTTAVVAILYYFGWARTYIQLSYFGVNSAVAKLSVTDYVLRSLNVTVRPLVILGILLLTILAGLRLTTNLVTRQAKQGGYLARNVITTISCTLGIALLVAGLLGFYNVVVYSGSYPIVPVVLAAAIALLGYGIHTAGLAKHATGERNNNVHGSVDEESHLHDNEWIGRAQTTVLVIVAIALIFWTVAVYAGNAGQLSGEEIARDLKIRPVVTVYSKANLQLQGPGVQIEQMGSRNSKYQYRYSGLRLLLYANGRYILLPEGWVQRRDTAFILDERDDLRFELRSG